MQLDPNFAIAWARLSRAHALLYFTARYYRRSGATHAKRALENAQKLAPNSPETLLALGYYQYRVLRDYGLPKPRSVASAKCYQATARCLLALSQSYPTRGTLG